MPNQVLSASAASSIKITSTADPDFSTAQVLSGAHKLGCHHIATSANGLRAVSVGFGGECKIWNYNEGQWVAENDLEGLKSSEVVVLCFV